MKKQAVLSLEKIAHSLDEASAMTGLSKGHLRNEHKRGKLRLTKSGRRTLVMDAELRRYLSEGDPAGAREK
jgi:excisionase family DNA binding protein